MFVLLLSSASHYFIGSSLIVQTCAIKKNSLPKEKGVRNPKVLLKGVYIHSFLSLWRIAPNFTEPNLKIVLTFKKENYSNLQDFVLRKDFSYDLGLIRTPAGLLFDFIGYINILMILFLLFIARFFIGNPGKGPTRLRT